MKIHFNQPYVRQNYQKGYEKNTKPSQTIPDQTMSIQTIMDRYARGLPLGGQREPVYNGDGDEADMVMNYERMNKLEKIEFQRDHQEKIIEMEKKLSISEAEKQKKKFVQLVEDQVNEKIKSKSLKTPPEADQTE